MTSTDARAGSPHDAILPAFPYQGALVCVELVFSTAFSRGPEKYWSPSQPGWCACQPELGQRNCQALPTRVAQTKRVGRQPRAKPSGVMFFFNVYKVCAFFYICPEAPLWGS